MTTRDTITHDPDALPDYVNVKLRDGSIVRGTVTGKHTRWPHVRIVDMGLDVGEFAPETLIHLATTGRHTTA